MSKKTISTPTTPKNKTDEEVDKTTKQQVASKIPKTPRTPKIQDSDDEKPEDEPKDQTDVESDYEDSKNKKSSKKKRRVSKEKDMIVIFKPVSHMTTLQTATVDQVGVCVNKNFSKIKMFYYKSENMKSNSIIYYDDWLKTSFKKKDDVFDSLIKKISESENEEVDENVVEATTNLIRDLRNSKTKEEFYKFNVKNTKTNGEKRKSDEKTHDENDLTNPKSAKAIIMGITEKEFKLIRMKIEECDEDESIDEILGAKAEIIRVLFK